MTQPSGKKKKEHQTAGWAQRANLLGRIERAQPDLNMPNCASKKKREQSRKERKE